MMDIHKPVPLRFWCSLSGTEPVRDWLSDLPVEDRKIVGRDLMKVQFGWPIGMPLCRPVGEGVWEVRSSLPSRREGRVFICFHGAELIALHAVIKKSQKADGGDLKIARRRMKELNSWQN